MAIHVTTVVIGTAGSVSGDRTAYRQRRARNEQLTARSGEPGLALDTRAATLGAQLAAFLA